MSDIIKNIPEQCEGMEYLVDLGRERSDIRVIEIDGHHYTPDQLRRIEKPAPARPQTFGASTLSGLVDYLLSGVDELSTSGPTYLVTVVSPRTVEVYSPIYGEDRKRDCIARCCITMPTLNLNRYMEPDDFNIMLQTIVEQSANRDLVLKFVGSLNDEQTKQTADDGFSQRVTIKTGVAAVGEVTVVNPVSLAPRRTFPEIWQPESPFVLRFKEGPSVALFETDTVSWQNQAINAIGNWLREKLDGHPEFVVIA